MDSCIRKTCWRRDRLPTPVFLGFPVAQLVRNPHARRETEVQSPGWEDPLENRKATHSSILAWRVPWTMVYGVAKSQTLSDFHSHFTSISLLISSAKLCESV